MKLRTTATRILSTAALIALPVFAACTSQTESVGQSSAAVSINGDFEDGVVGEVPPEPWSLTTYLNPATTANPGEGGFTIQTPQTREGLNLVSSGGAELTTTIESVDQPPMDLGAAASLRLCRYGTKCAAVNRGEDAYSVNSLAQTMTVGPDDVDLMDGTVHVRFAVAPVLQDPDHDETEQPYYFVQLTNLTTSTILYTEFNVAGRPGVPWKCINCDTPTEIDYTDWQLVDIAPGNTKIAVNNELKLELIAASCSRGAHVGVLYVDGVGASVPGLFVSGTAPAQANAGSDLTYSLTYNNGGQDAATTVVTQFTTPPGTTFQSLVAPSGANCTVPGVGSTGTVVCTFVAPIVAGGSGTYSVTVHIDNGAAGSIVQGNYDIGSTEESPLLGSHITTLIGCAVDSDCLSGTCVIIGDLGTCQANTVCGNGMREAGEGCDDGNTMGGDGCNPSCLIETGTPCNVLSPGATDDASCASANCDATGGSPGVCSSCGNFVLEAGEGCDDGRQRRASTAATRAA